MTSLPGSVIPRPLRIVLLILAWISVPLWPLAIASPWVLDDKGTIVVTVAEAVCSFALFAAFFAGRADRAAAERAQQEKALVLTIERLAGTATPPQSSLRAVH